MSDRPDRPGSTKRRPGDQLNKDNYEDEEEGAGPDPGAWRPADEGAIKARRKIHVKRGGQAAEPAQAEAGGNPFASIALTAPAAGANPFAGISLVPPTQTNGTTEAKPADAATDKPPQEDVKPSGTDTATEPKKDDTTTTTTAAPTATSSTPAGTGGFAAAASTNPFASLGGSKPFGGFSSTGGGFGALAAAGGTGFGSQAGGASAGGTVPALGGFGSGFSFGTSAFPVVSSVPLGATPAFRSGSTGGGGEGEEEEGGVGEGEGGAGQDVALFGNSVVQPVVSLPEQEKRTGEEEEEVVFSADGSLFEFDTAANRWRERGKGEFKVNATQAGDATTRQARMVMRQTANLRLLLNAKVYPGMPLQLMPSNVGVTFGVVNAAGSAAAGSEGGKEGAASESTAAAEGGGAGGVVKPTTWAVKIKSSEKVLQLHELLSGLKAPASEGAATGENAV